MERRSMRARRAFVLARVLISLVTSSCAAGAVPASPTPSSSAVVVTTPSVAPTTSAPTATPSPSPTATPTPTPSPTVAPTTAPTPTPPASVDYCAVRDVLTPNREYADHVRTYLDWTYALPQAYIPPDFVDAVTGEPVRPSRAVEKVGAAEILARRGDPSYSTLLTDAPGAAVRGIVYADLTAMRTAAANAGNRLIILSAYRSFALQQQTFDYWVSVGGYDQALRTSARAGHSEHQLGTVIDFGDGSAAPWEYADWATTPTGAWLAQHAAEYGFVMSYQKGQTPVTCYDYEPWHYRWVGKDVATRVIAAALPLRVYQANLR